ncbi:class I adenylate-forming enzyme family protein [Aurantiacibacter sp. MUD61]|uniref:class I adenylate-forming enzyme family protein n=1 Tax=Aurantiacibacter sp. MUD61 TaxID=3009083 RepID=UPI0022F123E8|nr:class I adenylate-forming enzyme family protein [Aurantiacibacter sp. MUD61]
MPDNFADFGTVLARHAAEIPDAPCIMDAERSLNWVEFGALIDRIGAGLQRDGVTRGEAVAILGRNSIPYAAAFCAAVAIGAVAAPLTSSATPAALAAMVSDCGARILFADDEAIAELGDVSLGKVKLVPFSQLEDWLGPDSSAPTPVTIAPGDAFNLIYSSGTTGTPKGIVQDHAMRAAHIERASAFGYDRTATTLISTPLYSNTTLVAFLPALAGGGRVVLMPKFDAGEFCRLSESERVTHAALVPVQYDRLMAYPGFDDHDLSTYRVKTSTSAPFSVERKAEVLSRWPGKLVEIYGMTEGGGTCLLFADEFPDKLHTVGQPAEGHDIRLIDADGNEVERGEIGEVVGHSGGMMRGYHNRPEATRDAEWYSEDGRRFIRHGDLGRFDADGFLELVGRAKDVIISGGFNIYPSDLEAELIAEPEIAEASVVGIPSEQWGETPVAFVVLHNSADLEAVLARVNERLGKTQRISDIVAVDELPRSSIGKVLKRVLADTYPA